MRNHIAIMKNQMAKFSDLRSVHFSNYLKGKSHEMRNHITVVKNKIAKLSDLRSDKFFS